MEITGLQVEKGASKTAIPLKAIGIDDNKYDEYREGEIAMTRGTLIQNIMNNYGKNGITRDMIEPFIDVGLEEGMSYDLIYLDICRRISEITGEEFVCPSSDLARAYGISDNEMDKIIEEAREELIKAGEDPDEYFWSVPVQRFMM